MAIDQNKVEELLKLDSKKLLEMIGEEDGAMYATPLDKQKRGLRVVRNSIERIKDQLCSNEFVQTYCTDDKSQRAVAAVAAIADLLGAGGTATVAVLIVHVGIENICADQWEAKLG